MSGSAFTGTKRFTVRERLGAGAMGVVYRAFDEQRKEEVALKTIDEVEATRLFHLKQEFRAAVDLHHPNLVQLHELVVENENAFFTMEYVDGIDLLTWIRQDAPSYDFGRHDITEATIDDKVGGLSRPDPTSGETEPAPWHPSVGERIMHVLPQLAAGLAALHDAGVIHRDIKPSNILIDKEGRAAFLDFGVSVHRDWFETERMSLAGTLAYMAPEQFLSSDLDPKSDVYALGVVLYEALTGLVPHRGVLHAEAFERKLNTPPKPPEELVAGIPDHLATLTLSLLRSDPRARPSAHELRDQLTGGPRPVSRRRFCGRIDELATLSRAFRDAQQKGRPHIVHVTGPSGIGKTALVEEASAALRANGATVLRGRCLPHETTPFRALDTLVDNLTRILVATDNPDEDPLVPIPDELVRLFPVLGRAPGATRGGGAIDLPLAELRRVGASAMRDVFSALCSAGPVVVWIDDFQWSDSGSVPILDEMMRGNDAAPVLYIFTYRSDSQVAEDTVSALVRPERQRFIPLAPLSSEDATALVRAHTEQLNHPNDALQRAVNEVGGLPFLLLQLASAIDATPGDDSVLDEPFGGSFLTRRLERLSPEEYAILRSVALAHQPVARHVVKNATGVDDVNRHLKDLIRGRLLRTVLNARGHALVPVHDRIRAAVVETIADTEVAGLHKELADAFAMEPNQKDHAAIARHLHEAGVVDDAKHHALLAAQQAMGALAFEHALTQYDLAQRCDPDLARDPAFFRARGRALAALGKAAEAAGDYLQAASLDTSMDAFDDLRTAAELLIGCGHLEQGRDVLENVLRRAGVNLAGSKGGTLVRLYWDRLRLWQELRGLDRKSANDDEDASVLRRADACWIVSSLMGFMDSLQSFGVHTQFVRAALASGEPGRIARAIALDRIYLGPMGKKPPGTRRFDALLADIRPQVKSPNDLAFLELMDGYNAFLWGHFEDAVEFLSNAERHYARDGFARWERSLSRNLRLAALEFCGRLKEVASGYDELLPVFAAVDDRLGADLLRIGVGCGVALMRDAPHESRELLYDCTARWRETLPPTFRLSALTASVRNDLYDGQPGRALERLADAKIVRKEMGVFQTTRIMLAWLEGLASAQVVESNVDDRAKARAKAVLQSAHAVLKNERGGWGTGLSHLIEAAHLRRSAPNKARDALRQASAGFREHGPLPLYAAACELFTAQLDGASADAGYETLRIAGVRNPQRYQRTLTPF